LLIRWLALWKLRRLTAAEVAPRVRTIKVSIEMNAYLASSWPSIAQVAQLTRTVTKAGKTTTEVVYLITTLSPAKASPQMTATRHHFASCPHEALAFLLSRKAEQ